MTIRRAQNNSISTLKNLPQFDSSLRTGQGALTWLGLEEGVAHPSGEE